MCVLLVHQVKEDAQKALNTMKNAEKEVYRYQREANLAEKKAKRVIGIWSDMGMEESKSLFWRSYNDGKVRLPPTHVHCDEANHTHTHTHKIRISSHSLVDVDMDAMS